MRLSFYLSFSSCVFYVAFFKELAHSKNYHTCDTMGKSSKYYECLCIYVLEIDWKIVWSAILLENVFFSYLIFESSSNKDISIGKQIKYWKSLWKWKEIHFNATKLNVYRHVLLPRTTFKNRFEAIGWMELMSGEFSTFCRVQDRLPRQMAENQSMKFIKHEWDPRNSIKCLS